MKKTLLIAIALWFSHLSIGQEPVVVFEDTINNHPQLYISSFNYYSSNTYSNDLTDKFLFGGEITPLIKTNNQKRLKGLNAIGGEFEQRIDSYSPTVNPFKKEKYGLKISFSDNHFLSSNIPSAMYNTVLFGNAGYEGDTMDFSFAHAQYQHYQKFSIGFYEKRTMSSIQISYIAGSRGFDGRLNQSYMLTQSDMDTVLLSLRGDGFMTQEFSPYWAFQGGGFAIDFNYNFLFSNKNGKRQIVNLKINNAGVIFWNKNSQNFYVDSTSRYTGFDVKDLMNKDSSDTYDFSFADTIGILRATAPYTDVLPLELVVQKLPDLGNPNKLQAIFGFKAILTTDYFPYLYAGAFYRPMDNLAISSRVSYGGFGGLKMGLNVNYWIKDKAYISIGTFDLLGDISKKIGMGRSANLSMYFNL